MRKFNLNDYIYVQITEKGWKHLEDNIPGGYVKHCVKNKKVKINNENWYRLQAHQVFHVLPIESQAVGSELISPVIMFEDNPEILR